MSVRISTCEKGYLVRAFELTAKISQLMRKEGKGGWPIVIVADHESGGDFEVSEVIWNEEEQRFEIHG